MLFFYSTDIRDLTDQNNISLINIMLACFESTLRIITHMSFWYCLAGGNYYLPFPVLL
jgi:hypothetical protein